MSVWSFSMCWRAPTLLIEMSCGLEKLLDDSLLYGRSDGTIECSARKRPQQLVQHESDASSSSGGEWVSSVQSLSLQMQHLVVGEQVQRL